MNKNITIINVEEEEVNKGKNNYKVLTVVFKNYSKDGKVDSKKLVSFGTDKVVWETLAKAEPGDHFNVEETKDEKGYFQWTAIHRQTEIPMEKTEQKSYTAPIKPTYETPEERAQRQVYIIRQSSISSAVELVKDHGKQPDPDKVIQIAKIFEDYVLGNGIANLVNDQLPE